MTDDLIEGFKTFKKDAYGGRFPLMPHLVKKGQSPDYFIISCIDSRANPSIIFSAKPDAFFAHKAMGAIIRPYHKGTALSAALQFAIEHNKVKTIIIMMHTGCGAIKSLIEGIEGEEILSFLNVAKAGLDKAITKQKAKGDDELIIDIEQEIILLSRENLKGYPTVKKALTNNDIEIKCWLFDMEEGNILEYKDKTKSFNIIGNK